MSEETGIRVENPTPTLHKQIKVKPKELFTSLGKAAVNGAFLKWDDLAKNGVEILGSLGLDSKPGKIAGLLIIRSLRSSKLKTQWNPTKGIYLTQRRRGAENEDGEYAS